MSLQQISWSILDQKDVPENKLHTDILLKVKLKLHWEFQQ